MTALPTIPHEQTEGLMRQVFDGFQQELGTVPGPIKLFTASPKAWHVYIQYIDYFRTHPTLPLPAMTCIRFIVSARHGFRACTEFNRLLMDRLELPEAPREAMIADPRKAPLEERERELVAFVADVAEATAIEGLADQDIRLDRLRKLGWADEDIFDATWHGLNMVTLAKLTKAFGEE